MKKNGIIAASVGGLAVAAGIGWFVVNRNNPVVAQVGDYKIHQADVNYRDAVALIQNPNLQKSMGREQLVRGYTRAQVLKSLGMPITSAMLATEEARMAKAVKPGSFLEKVTAAFGKDTGAYRRVYLTPLLAERMLYQDYFMKVAPPQVEAKKKADAFLKEVRKEPDSFHAAATKSGFSVIKLALTKAGGVHWESDKKPDARNPSAAPAVRPPNPGEGNYWYKVLLGKLSEGGIHDGLVERGDSWLVVRLVSRDEKEEKATVEAAKVPKARFDEWLQPEIAKVQVKLY